MTDSTITLHPHAHDLLFKHFRVIARIFRDVLGQFEIDYMAIALLTPKDELLFFSSTPRFEWSMIEHNLWLTDARFQSEFFKQEQAQTWGQIPPGFCIGLCIPSVVDDYRVVYTVASKSKDKSTQTKILNNVAMLVRMGRFCLKNIFDELPFLRQSANVTQQKPQLKLIINNKGAL